jgi:hypothetical protein
MVPNDDAIARGLAEIRRRRRSVWALFLGFIPASLAFGLLTGSNQWTIGFALLWMGLTSVAMFRAAFARCPRCKGLFHFDRWFMSNNGFTRKCMKCGLPLRRSTK